MFKFISNLWFRLNLMKCKWKLKDNSFLFVFSTKPWISNLFLSLNILLNSMNFKLISLFSNKMYFKNSFEFFTILTLQWFILTKCVAIQSKNKIRKTSDFCLNPIFQHFLLFIHLFQKSLFTQITTILSIIVRKYSKSFNFYLIWNIELKIR